MVGLSGEKTIESEQRITYNPTLKSCLILALPYRGVKLK